MKSFKKIIIKQCQKINFKYIKINPNINKNFYKKLINIKPKIFKIPIKNKKDLINFIFIRNILDFSLWIYPKNWKINGQKGFGGLHQRLLILLKKFGFKKINFDDFKKIISPYEDFKLAQKRYLIYLEAINFLQKYNNDFRNFIKKYNTPQKFLKNLIKLKPYQDISKKYNVYFYKKAQLLFWEMILYKFIKNKKYANDLTAFPDYVLPAILNKFGFLKYSPKLEKIIKSKKEIKVGSKMEIELRAATILVGEILSQKLKIETPLIDLKLWSLARNKKLNYHRTKTIFY